MPDAPRLRLITNNAAFALAQLLGCAETNKPSWLRVVTDPDEILSIPDGAKVIAIWSCGRKPLTEPEKAWRERRLMDGLAFLNDTDWDGLREWVERRNTRLSAQDIPQENSDIRKPQMPQPEIRNLVQTQRWT